MKMEMQLAIPSHNEGILEYCLAGSWVWFKKKLLYAFYSFIYHKTTIIVNLVMIGFCEIISKIFSSKTLFCCKSPDWK